MGQFGKILKGAAGAIGDGLTGGLASGITGAIGGLFGGIGANKRAKRQLEMQKKLNEQAAQLNYEYGEKAAENAYRRQMEMYERSYKDQSYSAMRKQMEDAGLSVGLMYGGAGAGGEGGATTGAPQGPAGGAIAGEADGMAAQQAAAAQQAQTGLGLMMMKKDLALKDAQIDEINATAEAKRAEAGLKTEKKITEHQTREWIVRGAREIANTNWIKRLRMQYEDEQSIEDQNDVTYKDEQFEAYTIVYKGTRTQQQRADVLKAIAGADNDHAQAKAARALAQLNENKAQGYWRELQIELIKGNALKAMAAAQNLTAETNRLDFEHKYGIKMTPLQWVNLGKDGVELLLNAIGTFRGGKVFQTLTETEKSVFDSEGGLIRTESTNTTSKKF